jgi:hypothetical protein
MGLRPQQGLRSKHHLGSVLLSVLFLFTPTAQLLSRGQNPSAPSPASPTSAQELFRLEKIEVAGGAELITIHARLDGLSVPEDQKWTPLVTVLRDTLGDKNPENDQLRYLWPLTYTRPAMGQRIAGAIPFFYTRVGNKQKTDKVPPPALDLAAPERQVWEKIFWTALQTVLLDSYGLPLKASSYSYRRNLADYRKSQVVRALSVLSLYQALDGPPAFSEPELTEIHSRLLLSDKTLGGLVDDFHLPNYSARQETSVRDERGHNWELLRQRAEAESLIFEPLEMPDGTATHALVWIAKNDLSVRRERAYSSRFLNISDPRADKRLAQWDGYVETRYFDSEERPVPPGTPDSHSVELIPLALYGLDNPKIPMLLVDFRDTLNPKKREMSRRVLKDVSRNLVSLSGTAGLSFFLGRYVYDFVTGRRGMDINQPSRLRTYSQLKLLLSLNDSLEPGLRKQIDARLEKVSLNPFENDLEAEAKLAKQQYAALVWYAGKPDGLAVRLDRDRRAELVPLEHGKAEQVLFRLGNILSFGKYTHREQATPEMAGRLDVARRIGYHTRFLREVAKSTARIEVVWNLDEVRRSLEFIAEHGSEVGSSVTSAAATIFRRTEDAETRRSCLDSLSRINSRKAKDELIRLSQDQHIDAAWKELIASYLAKPPSDGPMSAAKSRAERTGQQ